MSASTAAKESWNEAPNTLSGRSTSTTTAAAQASRRSENGLRSTITATRRHRGHQERALGRHAGAGEQQVEGGGGQCHAGRELLDREAQRQGRAQRQQPAAGGEHAAGDQHHVQAGHRDDVGEARDLHGAPGGLVDAGAHAGDQGRRHGTGGPGADRRDPLGDRGAQLRDRQRQPWPAAGRRSAGPIAKPIAPSRSNQLAGEIEPARQGRR